MQTWTIWIDLFKLEKQFRKNWKLSFKKQTRKPQRNHGWLIADCRMRSYSLCVCHLGAHSHTLAAADSIVDILNAEMGIFLSLCGKTTICRSVKWNDRLLHLCADSPSNRLKSAINHTFCMKRTNFWNSRSRDKQWIIIWRIKLLWCKCFAAFQRNN